MADIQFDEEQQYQRMGQAEQKPFFTRLVLSTGVVSTDKQAEYVLIGVASVLIIISIYFAIPTSVVGTIKHAPGDELLVPGLRNS